MENKRTASKQTLKKFGLSQEEWQALYYKFDGKCHICRRSLEGKRANVDHEHVKNWSKLPPEKRKHYCRGMLCYLCNKLLLPRMVTVKLLKATIIYLEEYEKKSIV